MPARKRGHDEMEAPSLAETPLLLKKLRSNWMFANLMQYIFIFGDAVKIDRDFDIEDLEAECLRPHSSPKLAEIGLCLLKNVSSHRGLTPENFDEYTRRQYQAKNPARNPFGDDENPVSFYDLDIMERIRVLVDLSQWTLINANSIKEKMELSEKDQASEWRIEPCGWDKEERTYFLLDDNRLYRRTDPPLEIPDSPKPVAKPRGGRPKGNTKAKSKPRPPPTRGTRASRRLKETHEIDDEDEEEWRKDTEMIDEEESEIVVAIDDVQEEEEEEEEEEESLQDGADSFGGMTWECIAVTLEEYNDFISTMQRSRDPNEKLLFKFIISNVMPVIEAAEEKRRQKALRRQRELEAIQKLATAKRSSRIADKRLHEIEEAENRAAEEKRRQDLLAAQAMLVREQQMERDRESRRLTREQRIKERELRRVLEEEALNNLTAAEAQSEQSEGEGRKSKRQLKAEIERKRKAVEELQDEDHWVFDCSGCGVHGSNLDDGSHSVACDVCNVWQHSACLGISAAEAEKDDFRLVCKDCRLKAEEARRPKPPPIKFKPNQTSSSPPSAKKKQKKSRLATNGSPKTPKRRKKQPTETTPNGTAEWHHTFANPQPPSYPQALHGFVAFKPERYYTVSGTTPVQEASGSTGFGANFPPKVPGQPPVGKFVNHSSRPGIASLQPNSVPKPEVNGHSAKSETHHGQFQQPNNGVTPMPSNRESAQSLLGDSITLSKPGAFTKPLFNGSDNPSLSQADDAPTKTIKSEFRSILSGPSVVAQSSLQADANKTNHTLEAGSPKPSQVGKLPQPADQSSTAAEFAKATKSMEDATNAILSKEVK